MLAKDKRASSFMLYLFIFSLLVQMVTNTCYSSATKSNDTTIIQNIDMDSVKTHVLYFSSLNSRMTGYPGFYEAADYIFQRFTEYGLDDVHFENYTVAVPIDYGANITVLQPVQKVIKAYPLQPNMVNPCPADVTGELIYVGCGELEDFDNKEVRGSIVLMDFNSYDNWLKAAALGAKAVVFIEPDYTTFQQAQLKTIDIPLNFPRLWVSTEDGYYLRHLLNAGKVFVSLKSRMIFENVEAVNVVGIVKGTLNESIAIMAHFDSYSIVPSLAPGAQDSLGIASLLELAKYFASNPARRTIRFVALSGYWQGLAGVRAYVDAHFNDLANVRCHFELIFSTGSDSIGYIWQGNYYDYHGGSSYDIAARHVSDWMNPITTLVYMRYLPDLETEMNREYKVSTPDFPYLIPRTSIFNIEPIILAGVAGLAFHTADDIRIFEGTPHDISDHINYDNLLPQLEFSAYVINRFSNDEELPGVYGEDEYRKILTRWDPSGGFSAIEGQVVKYDERKGWYEPVPNALVYVALGEFTGAKMGYGLMRAEDLQQRLILKADENGTFRFDGAICMHTVAGGAGERQYRYSIQAFVINSTTGDILFAPDMGLYGTPYSTRQVDVTKALQQVTVVVFRCGTLVVYDLVNPIYRTLPASIDILKYPLLNPPEYYGRSWAMRKEVMFYLPPNEEVEIIIRDLQNYPFAWIRNDSGLDNMGGPIKISAGKTLCFYNSPIRFARLFYKLNEDRIKAASARGALNSESIKYREKALKIVQEAEQAFCSKKFSEAHIKAMNAWGLEYKVYMLTRNFISETINTIILFYVFLLPAAIILERLLLSERGLKRMIGILVIFASLLFIMGIVHPAFYLASNTFVCLLGASIGVLLVPLLVIVCNNIIKVIKEFRRKTIGLHLVEAGGMATSLTMLFLGIQNLKRRKLRSFLIITVYIITTFSLTMFTSMSGLTIAKPSITSVEGLYDGIFLRDMKWQPLDWELIDTVKSYENVALVVPRIWGTPPGMTAHLKSKHTELRLEEKVTFLASPAYDIEILGEGVLSSGRWFTKQDFFACILPEDIAKNLGVNLGDKIRLQGFNLTVVGILKAEAFSSVFELDGSALMPFKSPTGYHAAWTGVGASEISREHNLANQTIILSYDLAKSLGYVPMSISIKFKDSNPELINRIANDIALSTNLDVYASTGGKVFNYRKAIVFEMRGWTYLAVPMTIGILIAMSNLIGSIYERRREIEILSSVGLSPRKVGETFLVEAVIIATVGTVFGYISGSVVNLTIFQMGLLPSEISPNSSSYYIIYSILILLGMSCLSALYPIRLASRLVTPSLERVWKVTTKPIGDDWFVPIPLTVKNRKEAIGILRFVQEFAELASVEERSSDFIASDFSIEEISDEKYMLSLSMNVRLAPFDHGITQNVRVSVLRDEEKQDYIFGLHLKRTSGSYDLWKLVNEKRFLDSFRKQLLLWKNLKPREKEKYLVNGE